MKPVSRLVDIVTLGLFLIALGGNCLQASLVTFDSVSVSTSVLSQLNSSLAAPFELPLADDEADDTPTLVLIHSAISVIEPVPAPTIFTAVSVVGVKVPQPTVLRI
jgi:hypothetical protein